MPSLGGGGSRVPARGRWELVTRGCVANPTAELFCSAEKLLISWVWFNKCLLST